MYYYGSTHINVYFVLFFAANFHLRNGATMWRLNWLGDTSARGLTASCGMMVNYRYFLENTSALSQQYMERQKIEASQQILDLVHGGPTANGA